MKCIYCEKEFEIKPTGKSGGKNRQLCYDCLPEGCSQEDICKAAKNYLIKRTRREKCELGCSKCGYNKCGRALEWHHQNDDKEYNVSQLLGSANREALDLYYNEIKKCTLLCSNCHREIHEKEEREFVKPQGSNEFELFRQQVKDIYLKTRSIRKTSLILHKDYHSIRNIINYYNLPIFNKNMGAKIQMLDNNTLDIVCEFNSITEASDYFGKGKGGITHIASVCKGKRNTAYGYKWRYVEDEYISDEFENKAI